MHKTMTALVLGMTIAATAAGVASAATGAPAVAVPALATTTVQYGGGYGESPEHRHWRHEMWRRHMMHERWRHEHGGHYGY